MFEHFDDFVLCKKYLPSKIISHELVSLTLIAGIILFAGRTRKNAESGKSTPFNENDNIGRAD